jgi:hypothetical protein
MNSSLTIQIRIEGIGPSKCRATVRIGIQSHECGKDGVMKQTKESKACRKLPFVSLDISLNNGNVNWKYGSLIKSKCYKM